MAFASVWCEKETLGYEEILLRRDPHSPGEVSEALVLRFLVIMFILLLFITFVFFLLMGVCVRVCVGWGCGHYHTEHPGEENAFRCSEAELPGLHSSYAPPHAIRCGRLGSETVFYPT